jgi:hypothetical protein
MVKQLKQNGVPDGVSGSPTGTPGDKKAARRLGVWGIEDQRAETSHGGRLAPTPLGFP